MADIYKFPKERTRKPLHEQAMPWSKRPKQSIQGSVYFPDLQGRRPKNHPLWLSRDRHNKVILAPQQVWVENGLFLWVVLGILPEYTERKMSRTVVYVMPYLGKPPVVYSLLLATFRKNLVVWEDEVDQQKELYKKWLDRCTTKGLDPETGKPY